MVETTSVLFLFYFFCLQKQSVFVSVSVLKHTVAFGTRYPIFAERWRNSVELTMVFLLYLVVLLYFTVIG